VLSCNDKLARETNWPLTKCELTPHSRPLLDKPETISTTISIHNQYPHAAVSDGVATISRLRTIIGLFCKRALSKRRYFAKETYNFDEPTNRSHSMCLASCRALWHLIVTSAAPLILTHYYFYLRFLIKAGEKTKGGKNEREVDPKCDWSVRTRLYLYLHTQTSSSSLQGSDITCAHMFYLCLYNIF